MKKSLRFGLCLALIALCQQAMFGMKKQPDYTKLSLATILCNKQTSTEQKIATISRCLLCQYGMLKNNNALCCALKHWPAPKLIQFLIEEGVDINEKDIKGHSPLEYALASENISILNLILNHDDLAIKPKNKKFLQVLATAKTGACAAFMKKYYQQINPNLFLQCALTQYYHKPDYQIRYNIYTWANICYKACKPHTAYEALHVIIHLQKHFYGACSDIMIKNNATCISNLTDIQQQFGDCVQPLMHSLLAQLSTQETMSTQMVQETFLSMCHLQEIIWRSNPELDIFENKVYQNIITQLFQQYFETTQGLPANLEKLDSFAKLTLKELHYLEMLCLKGKNQKRSLRWLATSLERIYKDILMHEDCFTDTAVIAKIKKVKQACNKIYSLALKNGSHLHTDLFCTIFACDPEKYTRYYETQITKKQLTQKEVDVAFGIISTSIPDTHRFKIEDIQDRRLNAGIRAAILTQLHNIPLQAAKVLFHETHNLEHPIKITLKPRTLGIDCARNILAYTGCTLALHNDKQASTLTKELYDTK